MKEKTKKRQKTAKAQSEVTLQRDDRKSKKSTDKVKNDTGNLSSNYQQIIQKYRLMASIGGCLKTSTKRKSSTQQGQTTACRKIEKTSLLHPNKIKLSNRAEAFSKTPLNGENISSCSCASESQQVSTKDEYNNLMEGSRSRKRPANPDNWKRNIRKRLRLSGKQYINSRGQVVKEREVLFQDCSKCRFKCSINISQQERLEIFKNYWNLNTRSLKREFLYRTITEKTPERIMPTAKRPRKLSRFFSFVVNGNQVRVCKAFYIKTLDVGEKAVELALKRRPGNKNSPPSKPRQNHKKSRKCFPLQTNGTVQESNNQNESINCSGVEDSSNNGSGRAVKLVKSHIESFPTMEPLDMQSTVRYLESELNLKKMYKLYKEYCENFNTKPVHAVTYRKTFYEQYNYSFHTPTRDRCQSCLIYKEMKSKGNLSENLKMLQKEHIDRTRQAIEEKTRDENLAKEEKNYHTAIYGFKGILQAPCANKNHLYYKRKLNGYVVLFHSLGDMKGTCYTWSEIDGKQGANEIGTCLLRYIKSLPAEISHVCFYSDNVSRNTSVVMSLLCGMLMNSNLQTIDHKFLESGHTEMDCTAFYSVIEHAKKVSSIHITADWMAVIGLAKRKKPYSQGFFSHEDIFSFTALADEIFTKFGADMEGAEVKWLDIKWIQLRKQYPDCIFFKYEFDDKHFRYFKLAENIPDALPLLNEGKLPISEAKKKDLLDLCEDGTILKDYHNFYQNLPSSFRVKDILPEPDLYDNDDDEEQ